MGKEIAAYKISVKGIVQGVGFRPHVYRLAQEYSIKGWVLNSSAGVFIEAESSLENLQEFARRLVDDPPPLALIKECQVEEIEVQGFKEFSIRASESLDDRLVMISPDIAICDDCKAEVLDKDNRRYGYPFTNCTNCGPRFTIIKDVPYDRVKTTMAPFPMCAECQEEYENPLHRRFHAQPNACPVCGPHTILVDSNNQLVESSPVELLKKGHIMAVKGLGGFHLAVNARDAEAVQKLRRRKQRDAKPFAVMVRNVEVVQKYCLVTDVEQEQLISPQAPIVVMECKYNNGLPKEIIHPGLNTLGVMLPYTPLHYLLFDDELEILIMTSANISDEPLISDNEEALNKLRGIADYFLLHNREIFNPCDDSVLKVTPLGLPQMFRRARGFVPRAISIPGSHDSVLAVGGEMKNTFCITRQGEAFLSQHWGDLNHYLNYCNFTNGIERFKNMLAVEPQLIAHDLHPNYQTTRWAREQENIPKLAIQHHYAHMAAAMADNGLQGEVLGMICDGTGWGTDGAVWGCEILRGDFHGFTRLGHLKYTALPGGDLTARRPYRMALIYLIEALGDAGREIAYELLPVLSADEGNLIANRLQSKNPDLQTSSCGRLFDAVAAVLGICMINRYEGQAAIELEVQADPYEKGSYPYGIEKVSEMHIMNVLPMWQELVGDIKLGLKRETIAQKFHNTMVKIFVDGLKAARDESGQNRVVLSGGVFHNMIILTNLITELQAHGFIVYQHRQVPPGDGGIALGQAIIASEVNS